MSQRPWVFPPAVVAGMVAVLAACFAVAEWTGFYLRMSDERALDHWLMQGLELWPLVCLVAGGIMHWVRGRPPREARLWPIIVLPLLAAVWLAAARGGEQYRRYVEYRAIGISRYSFWMDIGIPLIVAALPLVFWGAISLLLRTWARAWRLPTTPGKCPTCDYDLTGNTSGVCPECGARCVFDQSIPHWFYGASFRWLPELAEFPDARARYAAHRAAANECNTWFRLALIIGVLLAVCAAEVWWPDCSPGWRGLGSTAAVAVGVVSIFAHGWYTMRRALRRQLAAREAHPYDAAKP